MKTVFAEVERHMKAAVDHLHNDLKHLRTGRASLALLDVFGVDAAGIERVAAAFPPIEAASFRIDAIGRLAERDLALAMDITYGLPLMRSQAMAYQRIAEVIARIDPLRGLEQVANIEEQGHRQA